MTQPDVPEPEDIPQFSSRRLWGEPLGHRSGWLVGCLAILGLFAGLFVFGVMRASEQAERAREAAEVAEAQAGKPPGPNDAVHFVEMGQASFLYITFEGRLVLIIWGDFEAPSSTADESGAEAAAGVLQHVFNGEMSAKDGRVISFKCLTPDGKKGRIIINNVWYDLTNGRLFLVSTKAGGTTVQQLEIDLDKIPATDDGVRGLANTDPEVARFVAAVK
jgi:hypothetical protein